MGRKTKIDWYDATWNPVTGCLNKCEYCYARKITEWFGGASETHNNETCHECQWYTEADGSIHELNEPIYDVDYGCNAPYPFEFDPTFLRYWAMILGRNFRGIPKMVHKPERSSKHEQESHHNVRFLQAGF